MYNICAMFTNTHTCLFQSMTTSYFAIEPPQSDEYFTWTKTKKKLLMFIFTYVLATSLYVEQTNSRKNFNSTSFS